MRIEVKISNVSILYEEETNPEGEIYIVSQGRRTKESPTYSERMEQIIKSMVAEAIRAKKETSI